MSTVQHTHASALARLRAAQSLARSRPLFVSRPQVCPQCHTEQAERLIACGQTRYVCLRCNARFVHPD